jgi:hypothetical protein
MNVRRIAASMAVLAWACFAAGQALAQDKPKEKPADKPAAKPEAKPGAGKEAKPAAGQQTTGPDGQPMTPEQVAEMEAWMKYATPGENHARLNYMLGDWTFENKMWDTNAPPDAPPTTSKGTCTTRAIMDGRYFVSEHKGEFMGQPFEGTAVTGYDNFRKKYVATWIDNMGTGIMMSEGTFDPATKTYTYVGEMDDFIKGGPKIKIREVVKEVDKNKHTLEWYENRGGKERKAMEITYTRKTN